MLEIGLLTMVLVRSILKERIAEDLNLHFDLNCHVLLTSNQEANQAEYEGGIHNLGIQRLGRDGVLQVLFCTFYSY